MDLNMLVRLDKELVRRGLVETRAKAQFLIQSGVILVNERIVIKQSYAVHKTDDLRVVGNPNPWVSRAGLKLEYAIRRFKLGPLDGIALDIGASTGGFTDVLLFYGCKKVYAVDVGKNQLHNKLKSDGRVVSLERTNAKNLDRLEIPPLDYIVCDVSFISMQKVLKSSIKFAKNGCKLVSLIKPQFEVGAASVGKNGIVRNSEYRVQACKSVTKFLEAEGWVVKGLDQSPITGADGNIEFLIFASNKRLG